MNKILEEDKESITIKSKMHGIKLEKRSSIDGKDNHICLRLLGEDDGTWFEDIELGSSYWIDDLIETLQRAKAHMEQKQKKDKSGHGYEFK